MIVKGASVFCEDGIFRARDVFVEGQFFANEGNGDIVNASNCYLLPGFVDIHFHGCNGFDFSDGSVAAIEGIVSYQLSQGITSMLPTTMSVSSGRLEEIADSVSAFNASSFKYKSSMAGINMEGPFLAASKCGAQNVEYLSTPDYELFSRLNQKTNGCIRLCSVAPELEGALDFISEASKVCNISLGHTEADYDLANRAFCCGANHVTHLYNACTPFNHREPGVVGATFDLDNIIAELICDSIHVAEPVVRSTFKMLGKERIALISDSMRATGLGDGTYDLGGQQVIVSGRRAYLEDGTIAGSVNNLMDMVRNLVNSIGVSLEDAVYSATITPAKSVGIYDMVGSITPNKNADFLLLNKNDLSLKSVYKNGELVTL